MKLKQRFLIYPLLIMGVFLVFASSCKKDDDDDNVDIPVLTTTTVTDITQITAISGGNITSDGGANITARGVCWGTGQTPTISDDKTTDGTGAGSFVSSISGLTPNTTYYVMAYATNSKGTGYGSAMSFTTQQEPVSFTDTRDGTVYQTVTIGNQVWMAKNLRYLPSVAGPGTGSDATPYYYVYGYTGTSVAAAKATANYTTYGVLYNWTAAMDGSISSSSNPSGVQGVCPTGWHLPSDAELTELTNNLGGESVAGGKLKETGITHWNSPNTVATNETDFTALPGGCRDYYGTFDDIGYAGYWWSATKISSGAYRRRMLYNFSDVGKYDVDEELGFSVRCVKD